MGRSCAYIGGEIETNIIMEHASSMHRILSSVYDDDDDDDDDEDEDEDDDDDDDDNNNNDDDLDLSCTLTHTRTRALLSRWFGGSYGYFLQCSTAASD